ncbi:endopeptidase La [bacterium]|nr:endopeptidase La [bacterium]
MLDKQKKIPPTAELVPVSDLLPPNLFLLPVTQTSLFPGMIVPLVIPEGKLSRMVEHVLSGSGYIGVILPSDKEAMEAASGPATTLTGLPAHAGPADAQTQKEREGFSQYGVAAKVLKKINLPDNQVSILLTGLQRFELRKVVSTNPYYVGNVHYLLDQVARDTEMEALLRAALSQFKQISKDNPLISEEVKVALVNIDGPGKLADFMASILLREVKDYQDFLQTADVRERLRKLLVLLQREQDVQNVQKKIQDDIHQKISQAQKEFYLNEQLKLIQKELGRATDDKSKLIQKFEERIKARTLTEEARKRIDEEMEKLQALNEQSSEFSVAINYLDWATALPWGLRSKENHSLTRARRVLNEDHYGLKDVKERILEFLAVKKLKSSHEGTILCFVGPPGTGKTSLGKSIARALNRKFFRFSVGGMRDEAEIKGHRRTYVGAMPGKLIQGLKRVGTQNPVFLIDEIDKLSTGWASGGDPASALLELLDPEQNTDFLDHYLDIPFNCSEVLFITTANSLDSIPAALLDRMEIIPLVGYSDSEKMHIARGHLSKKQLEKNALKAGSVTLSDKALKYVISHYARESGVRNLERQLGRVYRKLAYRVANKRGETFRIETPAEIEKLLGLPAFHPEEIHASIPGVATGLAWTNYGGEVLTVESLAVEGRGGLVMTGTLGKVMQESANLAYTYVREQSGRQNMPKRYFDRHTVHVHVPAGATPKDGPSAGVTLAASMYSLLSKKPLKKGIAMTGEITLSGRVLPVGGIKEKLLAAKRSGIHTVMLPKHNERDLKKIDAETKEGLRIIKVSTVQEAFRHLF